MNFTTARPRPPGANAAGGGGGVGGAGGFGGGFGAGLGGAGLGGAGGPLGSTETTPKKSICVVTRARHGNTAFLHFTPTVTSLHTTSFAGALALSAHR